MKVLLTGNREKDLAADLVPRLERAGFEVTCVSRSTGYDFEQVETISRLVKLSLEHEIFINCFAGYHFKAVVLAQKVFQKWLELGFSQRRILNIGSTTDRVRKGKMNLYHYEKLALRELSQGLSLIGVWENGPKVSHISFGTMENRADKHQGRRALTFAEVSQTILWVLNQPTHLNVNELSLDPVQTK